MCSFYAIKFKHFTEKSLILAYVNGCRGDVLKRLDSNLPHEVTLEKLKSKFCQPASIMPSLSEKLYRGLAEFTISEYETR